MIKRLKEALSNGKLTVEDLSIVVLRLAEKMEALEAELSEVKTMEVKSLTNGKPVSINDSTQLDMLLRTF